VEARVVVASNSVDELAQLLWRSQAETAQPEQSAEDFAVDLGSWMESHADSHVPFVALDADGRGVGMAWLGVLPRTPGPGALGRRCGDIQSVYVCPEHRSRGIGTLLLRALLEHAHQLGLEHITVKSSSKAILCTSAPASHRRRRCCCSSFSSRHYGAGHGSGADRWQDHAVDQDALMWQLGLAFSLFEVFVLGLDDEEALREPGFGAWSVRLDGSGLWRADWTEPEPDPAPPTTVAWSLWHIGWWWSDVTGRAFGSGPVARGQAVWPGSVAAAVDQIRDCHDRWRTGLARTTPGALASVEWADRCWPMVGHHPFSYVAAWVNSELMKNAAEIGATRRILSVM